MKILLDDEITPEAIRNAPIYSVFVCDWFGVCTMMLVEPGQWARPTTNQVFEFGAGYFRCDASPTSQIIGMMQHEEGDGGLQPIALFLEDE